MTDVKLFMFQAKASGDGECFAFKVDKETFISIMGEKAYDEEVEIHEEFHHDVYPDNEFVPLTEFFIYPNKFFPSNKKLKISIRVEEVEHENT